MKKKLTVVINRWFNKIDGSSYFSARVIRHRDGKTLIIPFQYGYGSHPNFTVLLELSRARWIKGDFTSWERVHNYPIIWIDRDVLKRDAIQLGKAVE